MNKQIETYRKAGYTHIVSYKEMLEWAGIFVEKSFPTTADVMQKHIDTLKKHQYNENGDEMIIAIKAIAL